MMPAINRSSKPKEDQPAPKQEGADRHACDQIDARERLLRAALKLFSEQGYAKASTREIGAMAGVNIASIRYYFGDKAGLYRAAFTETRGGDLEGMSTCDAPHLAAEEALRGFFLGFLEHLKHGDLAQQCMRLHFREMLEPTGIWDEEINDRIKPAHAALVRLLCRHLGATHADDAVHRLAFGISGLALQLLIGRDVIQAIRPQMLASPAAIDDWVEQLVVYAMAMIGAEARRRTTDSEA